MKRADGPLTQKPSTETFWRTIIEAAGPVASTTTSSAPAWIRRSVAPKTRISLPANAVVTSMRRVDNSTDSDGGTACCATAGPAMSPSARRVARSTAREGRCPSLTHPTKGQRALGTRESSGWQGGGSA